MDGRNPCGSGGTLHFETAPLKIVRAEKQFMTDNFGIQYLDCVSNVAHVGHCHPHVVAAGKNQMATLVSAQGFMNDALTKYVKQLVNKLPDILSICYLVNSGSEANDLALRLARAYTNRKDVVVFDDAYHGNLGNLIDISPKMFKQMPLGKKEFVHVIPCPDTYRGLYREDDLRAAEKYVKEAEHIIHQAIRSNRKIACFVSESIVVNCGVIVPPRNYFRLLYNLIHEIGGVCIADEVQTGLGRTGEYFWAFESITNWWQGGLCVLLACNKDIQSPKSTRPLLHNRPCLQNHIARSLLTRMFVRAGIKLPQDIVEGRRLPGTRRSNEGPGTRQCRYRLPWDAVEGHCLPGQLQSYSNFRSSSAQVSATLRFQRGKVMRTSGRACSRDRPRRDLRGHVHKNVTELALDQDYEEV
ncbi:ethanolamine-phosphate phospho-lyase-like isoform X6 [Penaeus chinensis]|uniref:ethanolamine-phosphate phospho-lyase-like isoform X6 n=1 Tax=Penaeus chinensis TaxID=139456 RepID=UPI001FB61BB2|nr:ethanolamine-phosphate phospho-lyase-like isoform X6 [Penaeus chinensis]